MSAPGSCGKQGIFVDRHRSPLGSWDYLYRYPSPALEPYVLRLNALDDVQRADPRSSGIPSPTAALVIGLGETVDVVDPSAPSVTFRSNRPFISGLRERSPRIAFGARYSGAVVDLTPLGVRRLTGTPMALLANGQIDACDLLGPSILRIQERMVELPDWSSRFDLLERYIGERIEAVADVSQIARMAWDQIIEFGGRIRIGDLRKSLGVSHRYLLRSFAEEIGLPPKRVARLVRLDHALVLTSLTREPSWTHIALRCGYYDQAHLINEFRRTLGMTPTELHDALDANRRAAASLPVGVLFSRRVP